MGDTFQTLTVPGVCSVAQRLQLHAVTLAILVVAPIFGMPLVLDVEDILRARAPR